VDEVTAWGCSPTGELQCLQRVPAACERNERCSEPAGCAATCADDCPELGVGGCDEQGTPWICVQLDEDPCWERVPGAPCPFGATCHGGVCQSDDFVPGDLTVSLGAAAVSGELGGQRLHVGVGSTTPTGEMPAAGGPGTGTAVELGPYAPLRRQP